MAKGRKTTPAPLKLLKGTDRPDRMNPAAPTPAAEGMVAPAWLPEDALPHFATLLSRLAPMGLNSSSHTEALAMAAVRMHEITMYTESIKATGPTYETQTIQGGSMIRAYPEVALRSDAMRHLQGLLAEFGLTPASIGKVGAKDQSEKPNAKFGSFKRA